jgi:hypothetical protein
MTENFRAFATKGGKRKKPRKPRETEDNLGKLGKFIQTWKSLGQPVRMQETEDEIVEC